MPERNRNPSVTKRILKLRPTPTVPRNRNHPSFRRGYGLRVREMGSPARSVTRRVASLEPRERGSGLAIGQIMETEI